MKYSDFEFGQKNLKFWDEDKVELQQFSPEKNKTIRFFRKKNFEKWDKDAKIISRYVLSSFREKFEIEPWNQILIDEANKYGTLVDSNKEQALNGKIEDIDVIKETKMSVGKIMREGLIWVARSQMVCHPDSIIYGEIDEIWYDKKIDTYFVGDTKTSSSVDKIGYWYQLGIYIEILRALNPTKKISSIGIIDWVKIKTKKWVFDKQFNENDWKKWLNKEKIDENDSVYRAKWTGQKEIEPEETNLLIKRDLETLGLLRLINDDFNLVKKYNIKSNEDLEYNNLNNIEFRNINKINQQKYDELMILIKNR